MSKLLRRDLPTDLRLAILDAWIATYRVQSLMAARPEWDVDINASTWVQRMARHTASLERAEHASRLADAHLERTTKVFADVVKWVDEDMKQSTRKEKA